MKSTQYQYDVLDNLKTVTQGSQTRAYEYSTLGRMMAACNPETSTASCVSSPLPTPGLERFTYDSNGNLVTKIDARNITTTISSYDGLNRPTSISYSGGVSTPGVTYSYDQDWKGALSAVSTGTESSLNSTAYTHDSLGRLAESIQTTAGVAYQPFVYSLSLADELIQLQYPSGRKITFGLDGAGRISSVSSPSVTVPYVQSLSYNPDSSVKLLALGNGLTEQYSYNDRLQLTRMAVNPATGTSLLSLDLYPCAAQATFCGTGNNGNIQSQKITVPGVPDGWTQSYGYDALNRLTLANEGSSSFSQNYGYDPKNNWYVSTNSGFNRTSFTPTDASVFNSRNQLGNNDAGFDSAGAQTGIGGYSYVYDAENRMTTATLSTQMSIGFTYDGQGQRVQKFTCPGGTNPCTAAAATSTSTYLYDAAGNLAVELAAGNANSSCGTPTCYVSVDQVGSTRLVTDANGIAKQRYDYLPFGEEVPAGVGGRTTDMGYTVAPDLFPVKYTGQYRDSETLLDYFHARYYSPREGRFVSPDPGNAGADLGTSTSWNGYAYVGNNPLNATDPNGEGIFGTIGWLLGPIGHFIGEGVDALVFGPDSTKFDNAPNLGGLFGGCGGILGNCGSIGGGAWNEVGLGSSVRDPGGLLIQNFGSFASKDVDINSINITTSWPDFYYGAPYTPLGRIGKTSIQFTTQRRAGACSAAPLDRLSMTSPFGDRIDPVGKKASEFHPGRDYSAATGTPVYSVEDGQVRLAQRFGGYGNAVGVVSDPYNNLYGHLSQILVKSGDSVRAGQMIGLAGATGHVTAAHLHFEQYPKGSLGFGSRNYKTIQPCWP